MTAATTPSAGRLAAVLRRRVGPGRDAGSATLELVIVAPALLALLGLVIVAGRVAAAGSAVEQAAAAGARAASLARDAGSARSAARATIDEALAGQSITCAPVERSVDVSGFRVRVGTAAEVSVTVSCAIPIAELAVPGIPGKRTVRASATSPLDTYRGRS